MHMTLERATAGRHDIVALISYAQGLSVCLLAACSLLYADAWYQGCMSAGSTVCRIAMITNSARVN